MSDPLVTFDAFTSAVRARLEMGADAYRDRPASSRPLPELADELAAEVEDIAGWAACLWPRLRQLAESLRALEMSPIGDTGKPGQSSRVWEPLEATIAELEGRATDAGGEGAGGSAGC